MGIEDGLRENNSQEEQESGEARETSSEVRQKIRDLVENMMPNLTRTQLKKLEERIRLINPEEL